MRLTQKTFLLMFICLALVACSSPAEKRDKFMSRGKGLEQKKDYIRARLEYKNAIQVDPKCVECYQRLARIDLALKDYRGAYAAYSRAVEIDPGRMDIQLALGNLLYLGRSGKKAEEKARLVLKNQPDNAKARILLALALSIQKGKEKEALKILEGCREQRPESPDAYILAARIMANHGNLEGAEKLLDQGIEKCPDKKPFLSTLLAVYSAKKEWNKAIGTAKEIAAFAPENPTIYITMARLHEKKGEMTDAEAQWKKAMEVSKDSPRVILSYVQFLVRNKRIGEARNLLEFNLKKDPSRLDYRITLARLLTATGKGQKGLALLDEVNAKELKTPERLALMREKAKINLALDRADKARSIVNKILKENPKDAEALFMRARLALMKRDGTRAVSSLRILLKDSPGNTTYMLMLAQAYILNKEFKLAEDQLKRAIKLKPADERPWVSLIKAYMAENDLEMARAVLSDALKANPGSAILYDLEGWLRWLSKDIDGAKASFQRAIELAPKSLIPYRDMASMLARSGKPDQAEKALKEAVKGHPKALGPKILLATFYEQTGKPEKAMAIYDALLKTHPREPLLMNNLAYLYAETSKDPEILSKALQLADAAMKRIKNVPTLLDTKAWVLFKQGKYAEALALINQALAKAGDHPTLLYHKGAILVALGEKDEARQVLNKAIEEKRPFPEKRRTQELLKKL